MSSTHGQARAATKSTASGNRWESLTLEELREADRNRSNLNLTAGEKGSLTKILKKKERHAAEAEASAGAVTPTTRRSSQKHALSAESDTAPSTPLKKARPSMPPNTPAGR
jgi:hypothetical protein